MLPLATRPVLPPPPPWQERGPSGPLCYTAAKPTVKHLFAFPSQQGFHAARRPFDSVRVDPDLHALQNTIALRETIRLMEEIDALIPSWPIT